MASTSWSTRDFLLEGNPEVGVADKLDRLGRSLPATDLISDTHVQTYDVLRYRNLGIWNNDHVADAVPFDANGDARFDDDWLNRALDHGSPLPAIIALTPQRPLLLALNRALGMPQLPQEFHLPHEPRKPLGHAFHRPLVGLSPELPHAPQALVERETPLPKRFAPALEGLPGFFIRPALKCRKEPLGPHGLGLPVLDLTFLVKLDGVLKLAPDPLDADLARPIGLLDKRLTSLL
jgi:hypothetical protein